VPTLRSSRLYLIALLNCGVACMGGASRRQLPPYACSVPQAAPKENAPEQVCPETSLSCAPMPCPLPPHCPLMEFSSPAHGCLPDKLEQYELELNRSDLCIDHSCSSCCNRNLGFYINFSRSRKWFCVFCALRSFIDLPTITYLCSWRSFKFLNNFKKTNIIVRLYRPK